MPHHAGPLPQYQYSEQHCPPLKPAQVVVLPHIPFGETVKVPEGAGDETVEDVELELEVGLELVLLLLLLVEEPVQNPYAAWQPAAGEHQALPVPQ